MEVVVDNSAKQKFTIGSKNPPMELTVFPPAIAYHKGYLWLAWVGTGEKQINVVRFDLNNGVYAENASTKRTLNSESDGALALASDGNRLYLAFIGVGNHQVCIVSSIDGNDFTPQSKNILNSESAYGPQLAVLGGQLYIGFSGVNGLGFSFIGPASVDANGKANFNAQDKKAFTTYLTGMCTYNGHLVFIGNNDSSNVVLYRWQPGQSVPSAPYAVLPVKGYLNQCATARTGGAPGNLWISSFFTTSGKTYFTANEVFGDFYWYAYRVVDNAQGADIQGACSVYGDSPYNYAVLAVSDDGRTVNVAWQGADSPSHVNVGTIPANLTGP